MDNRILGLLNTVRVMHENFNSAFKGLADLVQSNNEALRSAAIEQAKWVAELLEANQVKISSLEERLTSAETLQTLLFASLASTAPEVYARTLDEIKAIRTQFSEQGFPDCEFMRVSKYLFEEPEQPKRLLRIVPKRPSADAGEG